MHLGLQAPAHLIAFSSARISCVPFQLSQPGSRATYIGEKEKPGESTRLHKEFSHPVETGLAVLHLENRDDPRQQANLGSQHSLPGIEQEGGPST
jgi:hypothetical protein